MKKEPFIIERVYNAPTETVWKAITNADEMRNWYFDIPDFKPQWDLISNFQLDHLESNTYTYAPLRM
jgi:uncharacterized protein YndB with AHSA1/START domain